MYTGDSPPIRTHAGSVESAPDCVYPVFYNTGCLSDIFVILLCVWWDCPVRTSYFRDEQYICSHRRLGGRQQRRQLAVSDSAIGCNSRCGVRQYQSSFTWARYVFRNSHYQFLGG